jgi:uncharacterized membrane protein
MSVQRAAGTLLPGLPRVRSSVPGEVRPPRLGLRRMLAALLSGAALAAAGYASAQEWSPDARELARLERGEILVQALESERGSTEFRAAVRIDAPAGRVFGVMTDCAAALEYVPHLDRCQVLETAVDGSWQLIEHEVDYGWYAPRMRYVFRARYDPNERIRIEGVRGDLRTNEGLWELRPAGDAATATIVVYRAHAAPRLPVPGRLMRVTLQRDLPEMLRRLRTLCESQAPLS